LTASSVAFVGRSLAGPPPAPFGDQLARRGDGRRVGSAFPNPDGRENAPRSLHASEQYAPGASQLFGTNARWQRRQ
jgi:hypothetical protein